MDLFVSDLHLCPSRPPATDLFLEFLAGPATRAGALYILGDLFEYWAGDDDLDDPFSQTICSALHALADQGTFIGFIPGNRDFLVGTAFAATAGLTLLDDGCVRNIGGTPTLLMHGDVLCTDDQEYQRFRATIRSAAWRQEFLARPLPERKAEIEALRRRSEAEKQRKPMILMDAHPDAVADALRAAGCRRLIHGHTHRPARHEHLVDGKTCERWVLGDWYQGGDYLYCDETGCHRVPLAVP
ncbi:UDP-2,3-diacylglucosamine diphosphatase [Denitratisoma oestradiolicum]|uniref:UDP-2,3-diacylglucosamine hydrolase n=1 Tax=Denitratisoma oestradiolicum TaxID=311182 RepID=A0A6S6XU17_9PROT|nr:UDP-2,3-diacylglucosamine diphosphatase [Denitratisoma oestradiolicum]TWO79825.1 UDP-2,3-diacylglucosamine diphosphatase [Denitratisoma oestradiolicum]CAB1369520.1 UDP-2,3-diacylglucosamine pyrophosphatase [Denitratisoma oestradiolicum]